MKKLFLVLCLVLISCSPEEPSIAPLEKVISDIGNVYSLDTEYGDDDDAYYIGSGKLILVDNTNIRTILMDSKAVVIIDIHYSTRWFTEDVNIDDVIITYVYPAQKIYVSVNYYQHDKKSETDMTKDEWAEYFYTLDVDMIAKLLRDSKLMDK